MTCRDTAVNDVAQLASPRGSQLAGGPQKAAPTADGILLPTASPPASFLFLAQLCSVPPAGHTLLGGIPRINLQGHLKTSSPASGRMWPWVWTLMVEMACSMASDSRFLLMQTLGGSGTGLMTEFLTPQAGA